MTEPDPALPAVPTLSPGGRLVRALVAFGLLAWASPGLVSPAGSPWMAVAGLAVWGAVARRPGRRAFLAEWLAGSAGMALIVGWIHHVTGPEMLYVGLVYSGLGLGGWCALAGVVLRRMPRRWPVAVAVAVAWIGVETLRSLVPPPFGWGWLRLGHYAHTEPWLAGSARVFGVQGLGFALALVSGALASAWVERAWRRAAVPVVAGLGVPALLGVLVRAPAETDGPTLLLVQPGIPQVVKQNPLTREQLFGRGVRTTVAGLARLSAPPDLVCWGESMLPVRIASHDLRAAIRRGVREGPYIGHEWSEEVVDGLEALENAWVRRDLLGVDPEGRPLGRSILPPGTWFLAGADEFAVDGDRIARYGSAHLWEPDGTRQPSAGKVHVVPGAETIYWLGRYEWVRELCVDIMDYVPDLEPVDAPGAVTLTARDGREYRIGISVCYDNSFLDPYVDVVRSDDVDFHLVLSNEAWYESSHEADQMLAFSVFAAITTGRSVVRATNSGVSSLFGPDGSERARLTVGGRDREVEGTLSVTVPVSPRETAGARETGETPFVRTRAAWLALWLVLPLVGLVRGRSDARGAVAGARADRSEP